MTRPACLLRNSRTTDSLRAATSAEFLFRLMPPFAACALLMLIAASMAAASNLEISVIDVEGGKAVLVVSPTKQSMLVDAGWPAWRDRPSSTVRIVEAVKAAGLKRIDFLVISHYDLDHLGDIPELVSRIPVGRVYDRGNFRSANREAMQRFESYAAVRDKIGHTVLKPGDRVPMKGVGVEVVASAGQFTTRPGAPNPLCRTYKQADEIASDVEDNQSIGLLITFGKFRMLDLADLEAHHSHELVCPNNRIGTVDVYNVNVHGQFKGIAPELVGAVRAPVIIQANGARKGADAQTWPMLRSAPGVEDIWQLHFSLNAGKDENPPEDYIANLEPSDGYKWIQIAVARDGTFQVTNTRNGFTKRYRPRSAP
jgi:competence protein ComEC